MVWFCVLVTSPSLTHQHGGFRSCLVTEYIQYISPLLHCQTTGPGSHSTPEIFEFLQHTRSLSWPDSHFVDQNSQFPPTLYVPGLHGLLQLSIPVWTRSLSLFITTTNPIPQTAASKPFGPRGLPGLIVYKTTALKAASGINQNSPAHVSAGCAFLRPQRYFQVPSFISAGFLRPSSTSSLLSSSPSSTSGSPAFKVPQSSNRRSRFSLLTDIAS